MKIRIFIILIFTCLGEIWAFQTVNIYIDKEKKSYIQFLDINKTINNSINFEIKTSNRLSSIKEISSENDLNIQPINFNNKRKKKKFKVKKNSDFKFRKIEKITLKSFDNKAYDIIIWFYSKIINIDEIPKNFQLVYDKSDYPFILQSNSCVVGNYLIFNSESELELEFEILKYFPLYLKMLKPGDYTISENNIENKLFSLQIKSN